MVKTYITITVVLLVVHQVPQVFSRGPPVITTAIHPRYTGKLGEFIRLICPIKGDPEPIFEWYRDGERVTDYWDRYRLVSKGSSLNIQRLECEDQGTFVCKAVNGFGVDQISFQLDLLNDKMQDICKSQSSDEDDTTLSKPIILQKPKKLKPILKPAGNLAMLKCTAVAEPLPKFRWFKNGVEITVDKAQSKYKIRSTVLSEEDITSKSSTEVSDMEGLKSTLQISELRGIDSANYTCRAENEHGWDELTHILEVVERQVPKRPEIDQDFPPEHTLVEAGQVGSLNCKVNSEFPPEIHWLKRITPTPGSFNLDQPPVPEEAEVESIHSQFVVNRTIIIGDVKYQILPSAPIKSTNDNNYISVLLLSKKSQESDSGYYVCVALNNAGFHYRQFYFNVTNLSSYTTVDENYPGNNRSEGWGDKSRADATTTAVVIVVVICGLAAMVASCFVWKRQKNNLKDKTMSVPASCSSSAPEAIVVQQAPPVAATPSLPDYSVFRDGLSNGGTPPTSIRSDPVQSPLMRPTQQELVHQPRVYYLVTRASGINSPRQQKIIQQQQRTKLSSASGRSGSGSRQHYHRSSPRSSNHHHYHNPPYNHRQPVPPEARSLTLTTDTSFHSDSFYPDWSAYPHHIRLPYPSPESSFDQL